MFITWKYWFTCSLEPKNHLKCSVGSYPGISPFLVSPGISPIKIPKEGMYPHFGYISPGRYTSENRPFDRTGLLSLFYQIFDTFFHPSGSWNQFLGLFYPFLTLFFTLRAPKTNFLATSFKFQHLKVSKKDRSGPKMGIRSPKGEKKCQKWIEKAQKA